MKAFKRIYLELSGRCNLSCPFCYENVRRNESISREHLLKIIPQIAELTDEIRPHVLGEPMLYRDFSLFLDLCSQYNLSVKITTNGTFLDTASAALMSSSCVKEINFSVQSYSSNTHGSLEAYIGALFSYAESKIVIESGQYINYRFWTNDGGLFSAEQKALYSILFEKYGVPSDDSTIIKRSLRLADKRRVSFDETFQWPGISNPYVSDKGRCHGAVSHIAILSDGKVVPCCLDADGIMSFGNVFEEDLSVIVKSDLLKKIKDGFLRGEKVEEMCKRCSFCTRFTI
jgi:radical SAM protein with 4Fe4S-binding SPASM domain